MLSKLFRELYVVLTLASSPHQCGLKFGFGNLITITAAKQPLKALNKLTIGVLFS
jgi:hypothetical protein